MFYSIYKIWGYPVGVLWNVNKRFLVRLPFMGRRRYVCSQRKICGVAKAKRTRGG